MQDLNCDLANKIAFTSLKFLLNLWRLCLNVKSEYKLINSLTFIYFERAGGFVVTQSPLTPTAQFQLPVTLSSLTMAIIFS